MSFITLIWVVYDLFPYIRANRIFPILHKEPICAKAGEYLRINGREAAEGLHVICLHSNKKDGRIADVWKNIQIWDHHRLNLSIINGMEDFRAIFDKK
eukprot:Ihof_evm9s145 gene=Ihof_evmTU9s145